MWFDLTHDFMVGLYLSHSGALDAARPLGSAPEPCVAQRNEPNAPELCSGHGLWIIQVNPGRYRCCTDHIISGTEMCWKAMNGKCCFPQSLLSERFPDPTRQPSLFPPSPPPTAGDTWLRSEQEARTPERSVCTWLTWGDIYCPLIVDCFQEGQSSNSKLV